MAASRPLVLSMGEPAGVGPEIIARAWTALRDEAPFAVIGDAGLLRAQGVPVVEIAQVSDAADRFARALPVLGHPAPAPVVIGQPDTANAGVVADWIERGVDLALSGEASGLVTAPIAKAPLYAAGFRFPGHTEFIAELTADAPFAGTRGPVMMLTARDLRACLVTIHVALDQVPELVTGDRVIRTARVVHEAMKRDFGIKAPRLAIDEAGEVLVWAGETSPQTPGATPPPPQPEKPPDTPADQAMPVRPPAAGHEDQVMSTFWP